MDEENEPEWMNENTDFLDLNGKHMFLPNFWIDFQLKTLEYDFKKILNVNKREMQGPEVKINTEENFSEIDRILESKYQQLSPKLMSP